MEKKWRKRYEKDNFGYAACSLHYGDDIITVYAKRWCEICNNWQDTTVIWKYGDEEHHLGFRHAKNAALQWNEVGVPFWQWNSHLYQGNYL